MGGRWFLHFFTFMVRVAAGLIWKRPRNELFRGSQARAGGEGAVPGRCWGGSGAAAIPSDAASENGCSPQAWQRVYLGTCIVLYLSIHIFVYLRICVSVYLYICIFVYLYICIPRVERRVSNPPPRRKGQ